MPDTVASDAGGGRLGQVRTWIAGWRTSGRRLDLADVPWRGVLLVALAGWIVGLGLFWLDFRATEATRGPLVVTERIIPAAPVLEADLGPEAVNPAGPHDGAFFYVIARTPLDPSEAAVGLDRPRYRLQRILFPAVGRALHPTGVGEPLVWTLFAVGAAGVLAGAVAVGALSTALRGALWPAAVFPVLGGCVTSLRITTPDPLAVALALWAVYLLWRNRLGWAVVLGVAAVLTKETTLLVLLGAALWQRGRPGLVLVAVPAAVAVGWWAWLRVLVPDPERQVIEFTWPFRGWWVSVRYWADGGEVLGLVWFGVGLLVGLLALVRGGLRHPLGWAVVLQLLLAVPLIASALAPERSAGRTMLAVTAMGLVVVATTRSGDGRDPWLDAVVPPGDDAAGLDRTDVPKVA